MADNTTLNTGSGGDTIRDVAKTANSPAKTQVLILDVGGNSDGSSEVALVSTTKGVQGANPLPVQETKDGGRTPVIFTAAQVAGTTTTTLITCNVNVGGTVTSESSFTVPSGYTLRVQTIVASIQATGTSTAVNVAIMLLGASTVGTTSPVYALLNAATCKYSSTTTGFSGEFQAECGIDASIPDGLEFAAGTEVALAQNSGTNATIASTSAYILTVCMIGFYY